MASVTLTSAYAIAFTERAAEAGRTLAPDGRNPGGHSKSDSANLKNGIRSHIVEGGRFNVTSANLDRSRSDHSRPYTIL